MAGQERWVTWLQARTDLSAERQKVIAVPEAGARLVLGACAELNQPCSSVWSWLCSALFSCALTQIRSVELHGDDEFLAGASACFAMGQSRGKLKGEIVFERALLLVSLRCWLVMVASSYTHPRLILAACSHCIQSSTMSPPESGRYRQSGAEGGSKREAGGQRTKPKNARCSQLELTQAAEELVDQSCSPNLVKTRGKGHCLGMVI